MPAVPEGESQCATLITGKPFTGEHVVVVDD
jgi:hypothetical protein